MGIPTSRRLGRIRHRHLNCFLEAAKSGQIKRAASALNISQPAASKNLKELEDILETRLFVRGGKRGLELTAAGTLFLRYASASVSSLRLGLNGVLQSQNRAAATVRVGAMFGVASFLMPAVVARFYEQFECSVRIVTAPGDTLTKQLMMGELDIVVGRLTDAQDMNGLTFSHLYSDQMAFVVGPHFSQGEEDPVDFEDLSRLTLVVPTTGGAVRPIVDRFLISRGISYIPRFIEAQSTEFCRWFLLQTNAVWLTTMGIVRNDLASGQLRALDIDTSDTLGPVGITTRSNVEIAPDTRALMQVVSDVSRELNAAA